jgi:signal transduction histidine kinase/tetratricopeptide (TPR) repeat protein
MSDFHLTPSHAVGDPGILLGRYRVQRVLKDGQAVRTVLADDLTGGGQVVVKAAEVSQLLPGARLRVEHEAAVLRRLNSPRVAPLVDFGRDGDLVCLVTPLVPGMTLQERLARGPLPLADALHVTHSLLEALRDAHDQGVLHRDVKPSNIIVDGPAEDTGHPKATLIDFGLARTGWLDPAIRDMPAGTVRYMSPEQAGLIEGSPDERSDLYSAGAVLFECLAGRPLFQGATLGEVLRQHLSPTVETLSDLGGGVPRAIEAFLGRLLAPDPDDRYQSADAALLDLTDIAAALARGEPEPHVIVGARERRRTLAEPAFVGRDTVLCALLDEVARARVGKGTTALVEAESGGGKSRLLEEFASRAARRGALVHRGQGVDQGAQRPFEVLTGVAAGLLAQAQADPEFAHRLCECLGDRRDALCAALPDLQAILGRSAEDLGPEAFGETRTIEAIAALLETMGAKDHPALILLDDGQWADELSLKLLLHWQHRAAEGGLHTVVVVAFRSEEVDAGHPLRRLVGATRHELAPLRTEELTQLAESMAGPLPAEATEALIRLSGGIPFMAAAVLRGLVESGALVREPSGWRIDPEALADARASQRAATFLVRRVGLLPEAARELLAVGAVLGKAFDPEFAAELAGQQAGAAFAALDEARRRRIVWIRADRCAFVHDKLRETFLGLLEPARRQRLHHAAAERLETQDPESTFDIAFHFDAAGDPERALPYALAAAELARGQHALQAAQQQYEIAERGAGATERSGQLAIAEGLGDVLMLRGLYDAAGTKYSAARGLADDRISTARVEGKLGELAFKRGELEAANTALESALRSLGHRVPSGRIRICRAAVNELVVQLCHTLLPRVFVARRAEGTEAEFVAIRIHSRLAHTYWFSRGSLPTLWTHLRELNLAERYPPSPELAQALSEHAPVMTLIPLFDRGLRYGERSLAIRRANGDTWGQGQSLNFIGTVLYSSGRFEECIERCREAVRLLERTGDRWEVNTARWHIAFSLYRLGDLPGAADMARTVYQSGVALGDAQARGIALGGWSKASGGRVPRDLVDAELDRPTHDVHTSAEVLQAQALRLLAEGDHADAAAVLDRALRLVRAAGVRQEYVAPIKPWLATALRMQAEAIPAVLPERRRELLRHARRAARRALRGARPYRNNLPHALREAGLIAAMSGHSGRAQRLLDRSLAAATRMQMRHEHAQTTVARAGIGLERGWPVDAAELATATAALAEPEVDASTDAVTPSLVDRFDAIIEAGHRIATALSRDAVYAAVQDAVAVLLRGERCLVLEAPNGVADNYEQLNPVAGNVGSEFSRAVARRAFVEGRTVILDEEAATDASESVVLAGLRSVLCAPIQVHGRLVACFYAEHRRVGGLFGTDEERLAGFIAALAGAALENAAGFAEIRELTRTLERRVADRTADLNDAFEREREITAQLRRLDQLKTEFMAMAAHDLRTPITLIAGFSATMCDQWGQLEEMERFHLAERISTNAKRLGDFVENLLEFARIESGELSYQPLPFDLAALVRRTVAEQSADQGHSRLRLEMPPNLPRAHGDEERYWQVLTNLFANAAKFSPAAAPIDVRVRAAGDAIEVAVQDYGPGIDPEEWPKLFRKFSRVDGEDTLKRAPGTGLGLYICKSIVEAQGGRISIASVPGQGATFTFTVPIAAAGHGTIPGGRVGGRTGAVSR